MERRGAILRENCSRNSFFTRRELGYTQHRLSTEAAMSSSGSVTIWLDQLKAGANEAAQPLWERYYSKLVERVRSRLASTPRRAADEEDVALNAFASFCLAAGQNRFPQLHDRDDLWQVLIMLSDRKAQDQVQF